MDVSEVGSMYGPEYIERQYASRAHRNPKTVTTNTVGTPIAPTDGGNFNPALVTSNTGPSGTGGIGSGASPLTSRNTEYAYLLFREVQLYNMGEIVSMLGGGTGMSSGLQETFREFGNMLSGSADGSGMGTILYHLTPDGLQDSHVAEGMGLGEFAREDGTFDLSSALAEMDLLRQGERSPAAMETEAGYMDKVLGLRGSGEWGGYQKTFEGIAAQGALVRAAVRDPGFGVALSANSGEAIKDNIHTLTNNLFDTTIAYEGGKVSVFF